MSKKNVRKYKRTGYESCPICNCHAKLVQHHIHGRKVRDSEKPWNLLWLCPTCHDFVHDGTYIIEGYYQNTLVWHKKGEESITGIDASPYNYNINK